MNFTRGEALAMAVHAGFSPVECEIYASRLQTLVASASEAGIDKIATHIAGRGPVQRAYELAREVELLINDDDPAFEEAHKALRDKLARFYRAAHQDGFSLRFGRRDSEPTLPGEAA